MYFNNNNNTFKKNKVKADNTKLKISSLRKNFHLELTRCVFDIIVYMPLIKQDFILNKDIIHRLALQAIKGKWSLRPQLKKRLHINKGA